MKHRTLFTLFVIIASTGFLSAFLLPDTPQSDKPIPIPASQQRVGNADKGWIYLTTGDYVSNGIPWDFFVLGAGKDRKNLLKRSGLNAQISHEYTVVQAKNGENLVAPNCLQCHAQIFNDSLVVGMGNTFIDFSSGQKVNAKQIALLESIMKKTAPKKWEASQAFLQVSKTIGPHLITAVRGVNAADRLAAVLVAHRDPTTLRWNEQASMNIPEELIPSDVPPWWLLKKKNAMFYNGFGRGDFGRFLMASNLLTVTDTLEANRVDEQISDLLAYIYTIQPPRFPKSIDSTLVNIGKPLFEKTCSKCHGTYGVDGKYPNLLIPATIIQTDSALFKSNYQNPQFVSWFNQSWFSSGDHPAKLVPYEGYIAPPLDGIWATAPYLHNGSIPDLESLLNSTLRPRYWERDFNKPNYDYQRVGWTYKIHQKPGGNTIYNTDVNGYRNHGHYFGDRLSESDRKAIIEYLKTL
jgi:mono/diheme cytochrome c family protein